MALGSGCAHPKFTFLPFHDADLWNGYPEETNVPDDQAKKILFVHTEAYRQQYGYTSILLLPVNLDGPGDKFGPTTSDVIPALIKKCEEARQQGALYIEAWGDGSPTREFLDVDAAGGIMQAAERLNTNVPVNLGSTFKISIKGLTETMAWLTGFLVTIRWDLVQTNGQPRCKLDTRRASQAFGFVAPTSFDAGLRRTIEWYRSNVMLSPHTAAMLSQAAR
ncbi:MAG: hypothetical protein NVS2B7_04070 [Herpetosiphon sp.]